MAETLAETLPETLTVDLCVIGAGSGGLSVAAGAVQMGASVALVERHKMGGDCLNYGCVPSKALLAAAHEAAAHRGSGAFGVDDHEPAVDFSRVNAHVQSVIGAIAPQDSVERFEELGVTVLQGTAHFTGKREIEVGGQKVRAKWFVIATGSRATAPPIPGLDTTPYLTNETVFDLTEAPAHLIVIGGGPIGIEMAQAHRRLGCRVTVLEMFGIMGKDDLDLVQVVRKRLLEEGVDIREGVKINQVAGGDGSVSVTTEKDGKAEQITGSHLLVAAGRAPVMNGLNLEAAGVAYDKKGITVDSGLRSSNKRVFAIGDVAGGPQFTHVASYHAGVIIRRILFRMFWAKTDYRALPWVTYTDPELAHVGLTEKDARKKYSDVRTVSWPFEENDRAQAERRTEGLIKVVARKKGRILGASIVGPHAGELILPWVMAVQHKMKIGAMTAVIAPYPTRGEVSKRVAGAWYTPSLFSSKTRRVVRFSDALCLSRRGRSADRALGGHPEPARPGWSGCATQKKPGKRAGLFGAMQAKALFAHLDQAALGEVIPSADLVVGQELEHQLLLIVIEQHGPAIVALADPLAGHKAALDHVKNLEIAVAARIARPDVQDHDLAAVHFVGAKKADLLEAEALDPLSVEGDHRFGAGAGVAFFDDQHILAEVNAVAVLLAGCGGLDEEESADNYGQHFDRRVFHRFS